MKWDVIAQTEQHKSDTLKVVVSVVRGLGGVLARGIAFVPVLLSSTQIVQDAPGPHIVLKGLKGFALSAQCNEAQCNEAPALIGDFFTC
jgi:hypothetical protein